MYSFLQYTVPKIFTFVRETLKPTDLWLISVFHIYFTFITLYMAFLEKKNNIFSKLHYKGIKHSVTI